MLEQLRLLVNTLRAKNLRDDYIVNCLKEFLQVRALNFIYNHRQFNEKLLFTGGTCLRFCFNLPRLSEDLDFDYEGQLDTGKLKSDLIDYFSSSLCLPLLDASLKGKKDKIYLKFPILKGLNLAYGRSHVLYLKIEPALCPVAPKTVEITTINRDGLYFFVRRYSLADLMSGKIHAFLTRAYFKGKENEIDFKGRDLFDLVWYMGQNILPNLERLQILLSDTSYAGLGWRTLLDKIGEKIKKMGKRQIVNDIQQFIETPEVLEQFLLNYFCVFEQYRKNLFPSPK